MYVWSLFRHMEYGRTAVPPRREGVIFFSTSCRLERALVGV